MLGLTEPKERWAEFTALALNANETTLLSSPPVPSSVHESRRTRFPTVYRALKCESRFQASQRNSAPEPQLADIGVASI